MLLGYAVFRLTPPTIDAFSHQFTWVHWAALVLNTAVVVYVKGYRGFHRGFSPRVVARAGYITRHPTVVRVLAGPVYCMGYFHIVRKKQIVTIVMTAAMVGFILLVRTLSQPWRGIIDAGIVLALAWGFASILFFSGQAFTPAGFNHSPHVPDEPAS